MTVGSLQGIYVPKGAPAPVVRKLFDVAQETMKHTDVTKRMVESGVSIVTSKTTMDFAAFWKEEHERFARVVRDARIPTE
jgi:tripartite-type tricarboxylate transporter receptor subunit TctC